MYQYEAPAGKAEQCSFLRSLAFWTLCTTAFLAPCGIGRITGNLNCAGCSRSPRDAGPPCQAKHRSVGSPDRTTSEDEVRDDPVQQNHARMQTRDAVSSPSYALLPTKKKQTGSATLHGPVDAAVLCRVVRWTAASASCLRTPVGLAAVRFRRLESYPTPCESKSTTVSSLGQKF